MKISVCPMKGWSNQPYIHMWGPVEEIKGQYKKTESCYWYQNPDTGFTDFLYHSGKPEFKDGEWTTPNGEGFGGKSFRISVEGMGIVILRGPWSGGCYCANDILPKPATEITITKRLHNNIGGYYTIDKVNEWLKDTGWSVIAGRYLGKEKAPIILYKGQQKKDWSEELLTTLQAEYEKAAGFNRIEMQWRKD